MSAEQDALSLLLLLSSSSRDALSLVLRLSPPGSYTSLPLLKLKPPRSYVWLWSMLLLWSLLPVVLGLLVLLLLVAPASVVRAVRAMLMAALGLKVLALVFSMMSVPLLSSRTGLPSMLLSGFMWML